MKETSNIRKILIVEDDYRMATEWHATLRENGYDVDSVTNAEDAILLLNKNYDCFILDLFHVRNNKFLPDGGIKCIVQIRKHELSLEKRSLIIAVTGYFRPEKDSQISTEKIISNIGGDHTLEKPFDVSKLLDLVENNYYN